MVKKAYRERAEQWLARQLGLKPDQQLEMEPIRAAPLCPELSDLETRLHQGTIGRSHMGENEAGREGIHSRRELHVLWAA